MEPQIVRSSRARAPTIGSLVVSAAENLFPGYFALVMATAAVSIASSLLGLGLIGRALFWLNCLFYVSLWSLTLIRLLAFPRRMLTDLFDPAEHTNQIFPRVSAVVRDVKPLSA